MHPFRCVSPPDVASAVAAVTGDPDAVFIAGGTTLVDLMKENVFRPGVVVDVAHLGLDGIQTMPDGGLRIGANASNADAARDATLLANYTGVCEAILAGASRQIRNMASVAGNVLQRTRCPYLRDLAQPCNKREPGTGCSAIDGYSRYHAIFGQTDQGFGGAASCIATYPSDMTTALSVFDAVLVTQGPSGEQRYALDDILRLPGEKPQLDSNLPHGELIVAVELPPFSGASHYLKARDRASYAFALVSCAVAVERDGDKITRARIALGSVAHRPWRLPAAEAMLAGEKPCIETFEAVAEAALQEAHTYAMNAYKVPLAKALIRRALLEVTGLKPLQGPAGTVFAANVGGHAIHDLS